MSKGVRTTGKFLVKIRNANLANSDSITNQLKKSADELGYRILFSGKDDPNSIHGFHSMNVDHHWLYGPGSEVNAETLPSNLAQAWEAAHAERNRLEGVGLSHGFVKSQIYVEPEVANTFNAYLDSEILADDIDKDFPPGEHAGPEFNPFWHLSEQYCNFFDAHKITKGKGVRIGHLDTGTNPKHSSLPNGILKDYAYNFVERNSDASDPNSGIHAGHGASTLALLAGKEINVQFQGRLYRKYIGGAPESEIIPMRIANTVVLLPVFLTSAFAEAVHKCAELGCHVVTMSMGGYPSAAWADAVNSAYEQGVVFVTAAGNNFNGVPLKGIVYPARFDRVVAATGCMYNKHPYESGKLCSMQGNFGPASAMEHAIAAFTPNTYWVEVGSTNGYKMNGAGTSAAAPQVAAACALWISRYGRLDDKSIEPWRRAEACRMSLFASAVAPTEEFKPKIGRGILNAAAMLDAALADESWEKVASVAYKRTSQATVSFPLFRTLFGIEEPTGLQSMYELEALHSVLATDNSDISRTAFADAGEIDSSQQDVFKYWMKNTAEISGSLRKFVSIR